MISLFSLLQKLFKPLFGAVFLLFCVFSADGLPLAEYRANVGKANDLLTKLSLDYDDNAKLKVETLRAIRQAMPPSQKIEMSGGAAFEVDNNWLETALQNYEKAADGDARDEILSDTTEKIGALENRLTELETAQASARSKNDDKQKLDEILKRPEFRKPEKSLWAQWWENFWKRDDKPEPQRELPEYQPTPEYSSTLPSILRYLVLAVAIALIGFILLRFVVPLFGKNRKIKKFKKNEPRIILGERLEADATAEDLLTQADRLARDGELRAAIRKGYIALLCDLSDRRIVGLAQHKTNRDYLRDVQKRDEIHRPMRIMTGSFENHWYGEIPADEQDWQDFRRELNAVKATSN